jgi:hypothetical protein
MGCDRTVGVPEHQGSIDDLVAKLVCTNHVKDPFSGTVPESRAQVKHAASFMPHVRYLCPSSPHGKTLSSALPSMAHAAQRSPVPVLAPAQPGLTQGCRPSDRASGAAGCWPLLWLAGLAALRESGAADDLPTTSLHISSAPGHVQRRRPLPLLRQLAALTRRPRECGGHGQEGPHLPVVSARPQQTPWLIHPSSTQLLTPTPAASS